MPSQVGEIYQVAAVGQAFGQRIMLTHTYRLAAINAGVDETLVRDSLAAGVRAGLTGGDVLESSYLALLPPEYSLSYWRVQMVAPFRLSFTDVNRAVAGTHASGTETANQAATITCRTLYAGRKHVSVKHIGPIPQGATVQSNGELTAAYQGLLTTFLGSLLSNVIDAAIGATWNPIIWHGGLATNYDKLTDGQAGDTVRVMRRRTLRVGE